MRNSVKLNNENVCKLFKGEGYAAKVYDYQAKDVTVECYGDDAAPAADPCKTNNGGCDSKRKCTSKNGKVTCGNCPAGYRNNGVNSCTKATDPCKKNNGGCHGKRKCTSKNGKVTCGNCAAGYVNNGVNSCTKVADPCKTNNGGCDSKRKCTSKNGKVTCGNCPAGYVNNGVNGCSSEVVDPCKRNNGGCHSKRKCTSKSLKPTCGNCPAGYLNNGPTDCIAAKKCGYKFVGVGMAGPHKYIVWMALDTSKKNTPETCLAQILAFGGMCE